MARSRKELCRTIKMFCVLIRICQNWSELKIRLFRCVKIILQQSGPHLLLLSHLLHSPPYPPSSSLAALEHAKPNLAPSLCISTWHPLPWLLVIIQAPDPVPSTKSTNLKELLRYSHLLLCLHSVWHLPLCYFVVCCLLLLPESKLCKSKKDPSVTVSLASKSMPGTLDNNLLNEWKSWQHHNLHFTAIKSEAWKGEVISLMVTQQENSISGSNPGHLLPRSMSKPLWGLVPFSLFLCFVLLLFTPPGPGLSPTLPPTPSSWWLLCRLTACSIIHFNFSFLLYLSPSKMRGPQQILLPFVTHHIPKNKLGTGT